MTSINSDGSAHLSKIVSDTGKKTDGKYQHVINTGSKVMNLIIQPDPILWESTSHVTNTEP